MSIHGRSLLAAAMLLSAAQANAQDGAERTVVVKLHTYPLLSQIGYGEGSGLMLYLVGGSVEVELIEWVGIEAGTNFVFGNIEGFDRSFYARAGVAPTLVDRRRGVEGYALGLDGYVGYHNFTRYRGDNEGNPNARENNHALHIAVGLDNTWWWSRHFGLVVRLLTCFDIPLGQTYEGYWLHIDPTRSYGVPEDERTVLLVSFSPSVGLAF
jgi:hypothetical protein